MLVYCFHIHGVQFKVAAQSGPKLFAVPVPEILLRIAACIWSRSAYGPSYGSSDPAAGTAGFLVAAEGRSGCDDGNLYASRLHGGVVRQ